MREESPTRDSSLDVRLLTATAYTTMPPAYEEVIHQRVHLNTRPTVDRHIFIEALVTLYAVMICVSSWLVCRLLWIPFILQQALSSACTLLAGLAAHPSVSMPHRKIHQMSQAISVSRYSVLLGETASVARHAVIFSGAAVRLMGCSEGRAVILAIFQSATRILPKAVKWISCPGFIALVREFVLELVRFLEVVNSQHYRQLGGKAHEIMTQAVDILVQLSDGKDVLLPSMELYARIQADIGTLTTNCAAIPVTLSSEDENIAFEFRQYLATRVITSTGGDKA